MHRVGAQDQQVSAGGLQLAGQPGEQLPRRVPSPGHLKLLDLGEVDRGQDQARRVQAAEPFPDELVRQAVVLSAGLPAHPAEHANDAWPADRAGTGARCQRRSRSTVLSLLVTSRAATLYASARVG